MQDDESYKTHGLNMFAIIHYNYLDEYLEYFRVDQNWTEAGIKPWDLKIVKHLLHQLCHLAIELMSVLVMLKHVANFMFHCLAKTGFFGMRKQQHSYRQKGNFC